MVYTMDKCRYDILTYKSKTSIDILTTKQYMGRIYIYEQDLTRYRSTFYEKLSNKSKDEIVIITNYNKNVRYLDIDKKERSYKIIEVPRYSIMGIYFYSLAYLKKLGDPDVVILRGAIRDLSLLLMIKYYKVKKIPVIIRGQGYSRNRIFNPKTNLVDWLHLKIVRSADIYLSYTQDIKNVLIKYLQKDNIIVAPNTLNTDIFDKHISEIEKKTKKENKVLLNMHCDKYIIYIGRLDKRKKIDKLLMYYRHIKQKYDHYGLIVIGDGLEYDKLVENINEKNIKNIILTGSLSLEDVDTSLYLFCSDILLIPGWLGLAINHGFYFGLPVIGVTPNGYLNHGPEVEYILHENNGYLMSNYETDSFEKAFRIVDKNLSHYKSNAKEYANKNLKIDNMISAYINAINKVKNNYAK